MLTALRCFEVLIQLAGALASLLAARYLMGIGALDADLAALTRWLDDMAATALAVVGVLFPPRDPTARRDAAPVWPGGLFGAVLFSEGGDDDGGSLTTAERGHLTQLRDAWREGGFPDDSNG